MILSVLQVCCLADDPWEFERNKDAIFYTSDPRQIYNAEDSNYKGKIVWTIVNDGRDQQELHLLKCISLESVLMKNPMFSTLIELHEEYLDIR